MTRLTDEWKGKVRKYLEIFGAFEKISGLSKFISRWQREIYATCQNCSIAAGGTAVGTLVSFLI